MCDRTPMPPTMGDGPRMEPEQEREYVGHGQGQMLKGDPWRHRDLSMRCSTCMWFVLKTASGPRIPTRPLGRCRRHAPTMSGYPVVFEQDWCGDHKLDENKP